MSQRTKDEIMKDFDNYDTNLKLTEVELLIDIRDVLWELNESLNRVGSEIAMQLWNQR